MILAILMDQLQWGKVASVSRNIGHLFVSKPSLSRAQQYLVCLIEVWTDRQKTNRQTDYNRPSKDFFWLDLSLGWPNNDYKLVSFIILDHLVVLCAYSKELTYRSKLDSGVCSAGKRILLRREDVLADIKNVVK